MLIKQTIDFTYQKVKEKTIEILTRGDRYKLFKFILNIDNDNQDEVAMISKMLDQMPELEILKIHVEDGNNDIIEMLAEKSMFQTKEDLFKILKLEYPSENYYDEPYEFLSDVSD